MIDEPHATLQRLPTDNIIISMTYIINYNWILQGRVELHCMVLLCMQSHRVGPMICGVGRLVFSRPWSEDIHRPLLFPVSFNIRSLDDWCICKRNRVNRGRIVIYKAPEAWFSARTSICGDLLSFNTRTEDMNWSRAPADDLLFKFCPNWLFI